MTHFEDIRLLDFVRGVMPEADRTALQNHLQSQCKPCGSTARLFEKVYATAQTEAASQVPEAVEHLATAIFAQYNRKPLPPLRRVLAKLIFDSFQQPLPAGMRSYGNITRQALYDAGDYSVDLRMEQERGSVSPVLVGQVASRTDPGREMAYLPVVLMSGRQIVSRTATNGFGEFQMEFRPKNALRVCVPIEKTGEQIEVRLNEWLTVRC